MCQIIKKIQKLVFLTHGTMLGLYLVFVKYIELSFKEKKNSISLRKMIQQRLPATMCLTGSIRHPWTGVNDTKSSLPPWVCLLGLQEE